MADPRNRDSVWPHGLTLDEYRVRNQRIWEAYNDGLSYDDIAYDAGLSSQRIIQIVSEQGKTQPLNRTTYTQEGYADRDRQIFARHKAGDRRQEIANAFHLSVPRIQQIIAKELLK